MLVTTFLRQHHPVQFVYILGGISLDRVTDSGVVMDSRMSFSRHIDITVEKALAMLGFMFQVSSGILILLGHFMSHLCARSLSTQVVYDGFFMTCTSIGWSLYGDVCSSSIRRPMSFDPT
jgi:hypothetical protein